MTDSNNDEGRVPASAQTRQQLRRQIDENLKRVYDASMAEELPDRFKDLLAQLGKVDQQQVVKE